MVVTCNPETILNIQEDCADGLVVLYFPTTGLFVNVVETGNSEVLTEEEMKEIASEAMSGFELEQFMSDIKGLNPEE